MINAFRSEVYVLAKKRTKKDKIGHGAAMRVSAISRFGSMIVASSNLCGRKRARHEGRRF